MTDQSNEQPAEWARVEAERRFAANQRSINELALMIEKYEPHLKPVDPDRELLADIFEASGRPVAAKCAREGGRSTAGWEPAIPIIKAARERWSKREPLSEIDMVEIAREATGAGCPFETAVRALHLVNERYAS